MSRSLEAKTLGARQMAAFRLQWKRLESAAVCVIWQFPVDRQRPLINRWVTTSSPAKPDNEKVERTKKNGLALVELTR